MNPELLDDDEPGPRSRPHAAELEQLAKLMDGVFEIPGTGIRFGLDAVLGLIPGLGDAATSIVSLMILQTASRHGLPRATMLRMAANVAIDFLLGSLPLVGDVFDVFWKSNEMNVALLQRHLASTPAETRRARRNDGWFVALLGVGLLLILAACVTVAYWIIASIGRWLFA
jgi:hypothetical protein